MSHAWDRICLAEHEAQREALYRFRYGIYVEEMNRQQPDADHHRRRIEDSLDNTAFNIIAVVGESVVGATRVNLSRDGNLGIYEDFYELARHCVAPDRTAVVTRFMVDARYRRSRLAMMLSIAAYEVALENGVDHSFMDCNDHLVRFFAAMGFVEYAPVRDHKDYGPVHRMRLALRDEAALRAARSPFLSCLRRHLPAASEPPRTFASISELLSTPAQPAAI